MALNKVKDIALDSEKIGILSTLYVNVKSYGAKGDGVTNDTTAIQNAVNYCVSNGYKTLFIPPGTYIITSTININSAISIVGGGVHGTTIQNNGTGDALSLGTSYGITVSDLSILGTPTSGSGILNASSYSKIRNVYSNSHGQHGMKISPNTWTVAIEQCQCYQNGQDGINAVSTGNSGQINAIAIRESVINSNQNNGITVTGTNINIKDNDIELNTHAGVYVSTNANNVLGINIKDNYIEANSDGNIKFDLHPSNGYLLYNANIAGNFLNLFAASASVGAANIKAITDTSGNGIASILIDGSNLFYTDTIAHVDLGNSVSTTNSQRSFAVVETGIIGDTADASAFYKNLGAAVLNTYERTATIVGWFFARGISYTQLSKSDNILSTMGTAIALYQLPLRQGNQFKKVGVFITTDSTNYSVIFTLLKINGVTGAIASIGTQTLTANSGDKYVQMSDISGIVDPQTTKLGVNETYIIELQFSNSGGGTNFQVGNPMVTYWE